MADKSISGTTEKAAKATDVAKLAGGATPAGPAVAGIGAALRASEYVTDPKKRKKTLWAVLACCGCCVGPFLLGLILGIAVITQLCEQYGKVKWMFWSSPALVVASNEKVQEAYNKIPKVIRKVMPLSLYMTFAKDKKFFDQVCKDSSSGYGNLLNGCLSGEAALMYPVNCDDAKMAAAIDTYIQKGWPSSPMIGKGAYMVEAAKRAGINPFLMAAQAQKESQFGSDPNSLPQYFNPFGTTGSGPNNQRHNRFTTYTSWEQAMDDYAVNYIRRYIAVEGDRTLSDIINRYAPPSENDTNAYIQETTSRISQLFSMAGCTPGGGTTDGCGPISAAATNIIETARSYIGLITKYSQSLRTSFSAGYADCSSFVTMVLQKIGVSTAILATGSMSDAWDSGQNPQVKPVMLPHRILTSEEMSQIQPGDIVIFGSAHTTNNAHTAIIEAVDGDTLYYIDCTSRGAGGVQHRNRSRTAGSVWGIYRVVST